MRNLKKLAFSCLILLTVVACKKDDDGGENGAAGDGIIQAKVGGTAWTSVKMSTSAQYVAAGKALTILGVDMGGKTVNLIINNYDGSTGTWQIPNSVGGIGVVATYIEASISGSKTWVAPYAGSGVIGEIKISEFVKTGNVKGTFKFKARNQNDNTDFKDITEGSFNVKVNSY
jgi:hypothetical protein